MNPKTIHRILVVDDNPDIHADFRKVLAGENSERLKLAETANALFNRNTSPGNPSLLFEVDSATQGKEGLELIKKALAEGRPYEVAFVDMRMPPGWDGLESIVRYWEVQPHLQAIICTAYSDHSWEDINRRLAQNDRFLILKKPFDNVEVRQLASALTSRARVERELDESSRRVVEASRHAGMAEVATGVLHNVGNVLNSVNVAATLVRDRVRQSKISALSKVVRLLNDHQANIGAFFASDPRAQKLPEFLSALWTHLAEEQTVLIKELDALTNNIEHIKEIVSMQQAYARVSGVIETLSASALVADALSLRAASFTRHGIEIVRDFTDAPPVAVDKHKALQILINLLSNAKHAVSSHEGSERRITIRIRQEASGNVTIAVEDTGTGIAPENLIKIFQYGFTTKRGGHGFGLHSSANAAREMGGSLTAKSAGLGHGATFTFELPAASTLAQPKAA